MKLAYYPGCSGEGTSTEYEASTRAVCRALGLEFAEIEDWNCCGSTPAHAMDIVNNKVSRFDFCKIGDRFPSQFFLCRRTLFLKQRGVSKNCKAYVVADKAFR